MNRTPIGLKRLLVLISITLLGPVPGCLSADESDAVLKPIQEMIESNHQPSDKMREQIEQILEKQPDNYRAHLVLGMYFDQLGLPDQANQQYELATKYGPNDPKAFQKLIEGRMRTGDKDAAAGLLTAARKKFPDNPEILFLAGSDLLNHNRFALAQPLLAQALKRKPDLPGLAPAYAQLFMLQRRFPEALSLAQYELDRLPNSAAANSVKGMCLSSLGRNAQAEAPLGKAFVAEKGSKSEIDDRLARVSYWLGHYDKAINPVLAHIAVNANQYDDDHPMKYMLVMCLKKIDPNTAETTITDVSTSMAQAKANPFYFHCVAQALDEAGLPALAIPRYKEALALKPDYAAAAFDLGKDLESYSRDYAQAKQYYEQARLQGIESAGPYIDRIDERLPQQNKDLAWQIREWLQKSQHNGEMQQRAATRPVNAN